MTVAGGKWITTAAAVTILLGLALFLKNSGPETRFLPQCGLHVATGLHCSSCGATRAARALLAGDLQMALRQNAFLFVALPFLICGAAYTWLRWVFPHRFTTRGLLSGWKWRYSLAIVAAFLLFGVVRNIPQHPFSLLAPVPITEKAVTSNPEAPPRSDPQLETL